MLANVRIVLVHTTHPGNIGAVARAMKNMCLSELWLVAPRFFPNADATARASGADELLARARVCGTLDEALADCRLVVGTSARDRHVDWLNCEPRECAALLAGEAARGPVALVFGRESSGLTNEELDRCDVPRSLKGAGITLVVSGILALAFMGFTGVDRGLELLLR